VIISTKSNLKGVIVKLWSKILSFGGGVAVLVSLWSGNLPGLFGIGVIAILISVGLWFAEKRQKS
jgi:uncharacterized membrane protein